MTAQQALAHWRYCVAPMLDGTTPPCRYFYRLLSKQVRLYSEMLFADAVLHNPALIAHQLPLQQPQQHALQLGGSDPKALGAAASVVAHYRNSLGAGYDEINFNCGCPSERVQSGNFGACLMTQPALVADCVKAIADSNLVVSVKHRLGIDTPWPYSRLRDFVGTVAAAGCTHFIVHARIAILQGLSPKQNRSVPPLDYLSVYRLKQDFPALTIVINGGIVSAEQIHSHLAAVDGVMLGRQIYNHPSDLAMVDRLYFADPNSQQSVHYPLSNTAATAWIEAMADYAKKYPHIPLVSILKPLHNLLAHTPEAKRFRILCSDIAAIKKISAQHADDFWCRLKECVVRSTADLAHQQ